MVRIGTCPICMQPVRIPSDLGAKCRVRCPTCEAEYPLGEVPVEAAPTAQSDAPSPMEFLKRLEQEAYGPQQPPTPPELIPVAASPEEAEQALSASEEAMSVVEEECRLAEEALSEAELVVETEPRYPETQQALGAEHALSEALQVGPGHEKDEPLLVEEVPALREEKSPAVFSLSSGNEAEASIQAEAGTPDAPEAEPWAEGAPLTDEEFSSISGQEKPSDVYAPAPVEAPAGEMGLAEAPTTKAAPGELPSAEAGAGEAGVPAEVPAEAGPTEALAEVPAEAGPPETLAETGPPEAAAQAGLPEASPETGLPEATAEAGLEPGQAEQAPPETALAEAPAGEAPPVDLDPLVRSPLSQEAFPLSQLIVQATGEPIGPVAAAMIVRLGLLRPLSEEEAAAMAPAPAAEAEAAAETFDFGRLEAASAEGAPALPISVRPRKRAEISPVKELIGIVLGGAVGLLIGYYILNIFWGPRYNFLQIYLPGVRHTYKYAPAWVPGWAKGGRESPGSQEESGPSESSKNNQNNKVQSGPKSKPTSPEGTAPANSSAAGEQPQSPKEPVQQAGPPPSGAAEKPPTNKPKGKPSGKSAATAKPVKLQVIGAPSYTADDLAQAIQAVEEVFGCKQCHSTGQQTKTVTQVQQVDGQPKEVTGQMSTPCEACQGNPPKAVSEESFERFCRLAEVLCFLSGPEDKSADRRLAAHKLLQYAAQEPANAEKIGPWAAARWQDAGRLSMGLLAAGKLGGPKQQGPWQLYELHLAGTESKLPLLLTTTPPAQPGDQVLVLGAIVEDPSDNLPGYPGKEPALLIGALILKTR